MASCFSSLGSGNDEGKPWSEEQHSRKLTAFDLLEKRRNTMKTRRTFVNRKVLTQLLVLKRQQGNGETKRGGGERPSGNRHTRVYPGSDLCQIGPLGISA